MSTFELTAMLFLPFSNTSAVKFSLLFNFPQSPALQTQEDWSQETKGDRSKSLDSLDYHSPLSCLDFSKDLLDYLSTVLSPFYVIFMLLTS